jgi:hypothetical protein
MPPLYVVVMPPPTVVVFNPGATAIDGWVGCKTVDFWSVVRNAVGNDHDDTGIYLYTHFRNRLLGGLKKWYQFYRPIILYLLTGIPSHAEIMEVTLSVYGKDKRDQLSCNPTLNVFTSAPASNTALADADYSTLGETPLSNSPITYAGFKVDDWNDFFLNLEGRSVVTEALHGDGIVKLGLREASYDAPNIEPPWVNDLFLSWFVVNSSRSAHPPKLTIKYAA